MKILLTIISLFALISCAHQNQKIRVDFSLDEKKSNIGNDVGISLAVFDDRLENKFFGTKEFCDDQKISITSNQNLAELLENEINNQLLRKGFKQGNEKIVEIRIQNLKYEASCGFLLGRSKADVSVKVSVTSSKGKIKTTKNFGLTANSKHFLLPLASTDADTINNVLSQVVRDILEDDMIVRNLSQ